MSDLFVEVDEAMKQERLANLWQKYGGFVIGFLVMIVLGTAANEGYISLQASKNQAQTSNFLKVTNDKDNTALSELSPELLSLIDIKEAGLIAQEATKAEAQKLYTKISSDENAYKPVKQIAAYIALSEQENTTDKIAAITALVADETHPWRFHAYLDLAVLEATVNNDYTKARGHLKRLIDEAKLPSTLRQKAQSLDILYGLKQTI
ncbi:MAG: hypothetical protein ACRBCK_06790 [Alphaproteobacteria bacterium]